MTTYDVFLSHNSADKVEVEAIAVRLQHEAQLQPFLDTWHLVPGESWIPALERAIEGSKTVAVFFGPRGASAWRDEEQQLALVHGAQRRDKRVIPVLLPGAHPRDVEGFLSLRTWVDLAEPHGFSRLIAGITGQAPGPPTGPGQPRAPVESPPPAPARTTGPQLVDELARVLWEPDNARILVMRAGFPPQDIPNFRTPLVFWTHVLEAAGHGKIVGGVRAIADAAATLYPANAIFARYRGGAAGGDGS